MSNVLLVPVGCDRCNNTAERKVYYGSHHEYMCRDCALKEFEYRHMTGPA